MTTNPQLNVFSTEREILLARLFGMVDGCDLIGGCDTGIAEWVWEGLLALGYIEEDETNCYFVSYKGVEALRNAGYTLSTDRTYSQEERGDLLHKLFNISFVGMPKYEQSTYQELFDLGYLFYTTDFTFIRYNLTDKGRFALLVWGYELPAYDKGTIL